MHASYFRVTIEGIGRFPCPVCRVVTDYQFESHTPVAVGLAGAFPAGEQLQRVRCLGCDTLFAENILDATGAERPRSPEEVSADACLIQQAAAPVVRLTESARAEVRRRMAMAGFDQATGVRLVRDRKRPDRCLAQFDTLEINAEYDLLQRDAELYLILDHREAEKLRGATIDYHDDEFVVSAS